MRAKDEVVVAQGHAGAGDGGLLSDAEVSRARDEPGVHLLYHGLFEEADLQHASVQLDLLALGQAHALSSRSIATSV